MNCKSCGSENWDYLGVADGAGDYGDSVCDEFECLDCGYIFEGPYEWCNDDDDHYDPMEFYENEWDDGNYSEENLSD